MIVIIITYYIVRLVIFSYVGRIFPCVAERHTLSFYDCALHVSSVLVHAFLHNTSYIHQVLTPHTFVVVPLGIHSVRWMAAVLDRHTSGAPRLYDFEKYKLPYY